MRKWKSYVDQAIQEARERGEFDPVQGKGKKLVENGSEVHAGNKAMAYKVLSNSGFAPPFLMKKREVDDMLDKERARLLRYTRRRRYLWAEADSVADELQQLALRERAEADWVWAIEQFEKALPEINKQIQIFNLINKIPTMFKKRVYIKNEIAWAEEEVEKEAEVDKEPTSAE